MEEVRSDNPENLIMNFVVSASLLVIGSLLIRVAKRKSQISLPLTIGVGMVFFGICMVAMECDVLIKGKSEDLVAGFILAAIFLVAGILLIRSGHQTIQKERNKQVENKDFLPTEKSDS